MSSDFRAGIVRILLGPGEGTAGTGFVVSNEGLIATCAHVVENAHAGPGDTISLIFYAAREKGEQKATVLKDYWKASNAEDVALLRLENELPEEVKPLPLGRSLKIRHFSTFGYPNVASIDGRWGDGWVLGPLEMKNIQRLQLRSEEITKGVSGAPVWDDNLKAVIGMVIGMGKSRSIEWAEAEIMIPADPYGRFRHAAFATPTETLWKIYPALRPSNQCPYLGLKEFTRSDARYFFGREMVLNKLVKSLKSQQQFLAVLGPSGSGKSSLVQAGLRPLLEEGAVFSSRQWEIISTRPTDDTFKETITSLRQKQQHIALVIDQFEELFWAYSEEQCQEVLMLLKELLERSLRFHLILTLRDDFYSRFVQLKALEKWVKNGIENVSSTLQPKEVKDIIQRPADIVHLSFDEGLVEIIVNDVFKMYPSSGSKKIGTFNNVLPLLEVALRELWEESRERWEKSRDQDRGKLTLNVYHIIGGVAGALAKSADEVYLHNLTQSERELARRIFTQLVYANPMDANEDETPQILYTRRRRRKDDLIRTITSDQSMAEQVIQRLTRARLLVTNWVGEQATIEISHEALIYEWPTLRSLLNEDCKDIMFQQSLSKDATEWEQRKQSKDLLYRGDKLKQAKAWMRDNVLNPQEAAFIRASATQQIRWHIRLLAVVLLLISSLGIAGWYVFLQPKPTLVTTDQDSGVGSLRWCIANASSGSTISFAQNMTGTIKLTGGDLVFSGDKTLTISGPGANQLAVSGANIGAIIHVSKGATITISGLSFKNSITNIHAFIFNEGTLTLTNSIISNNKTNSFYTNEAISGIENKGTLTVIDSTISNNTSIGFATGGSGIYNEGQLTVNRSIISNNSSHAAVGAGGGIFNKAIALVTNSIFSNNIISDEKTTTDAIGWLMGGGMYNSGKLTVTNSTFSNNQAIGSRGEGRGGGITNFTSGILTVTDSTFSGNIAKNTITSSQGGGIDNGGKLTVTNSTFSNNQAISSSRIGFAGGIANNDKGILIVTGSTFSGNIAKGDTKNGQGGGIDNAGKLAVKDSTFSNNSASGNQYATAGGINNSTTGTLIVTGSTFSGNIAKSDKQTSRGGGMYNGGKLTVANSTFLNDQAVSSSVRSFGGGIFSLGHEGSYTVIRFCTIYENSSNSGGGIWDDPTGSSHLTISSSIIAHNSADDGTDVFGTVISEDYNLIENVVGANGLNAQTDKQVKLADLKIEPTLGNHGGPTQTLALLQGSQAVGIVPLQACSISIIDVSGLTVTITTDQRGERRPGESKKMCDVGAYESSY